MNKNRIEVLCPGKRCPKCMRIVSFLNNFIKDNSIKADIEIVTGLSNFLKYNTWILPSVYINGKKVSRGYNPNPEDILANLNL
jgi:hypothetical protein